METINQPGFQAVFVNTDNHPKKVVRHPYFKVVEYGVKDIDKGVFQLQTWTYDHPDADGYANVDILTWARVNVARHSIPAFEAMCKGMEGLEGLII